MQRFMFFYLSRLLLQTRKELFISNDFHRVTSVILLVRLSVIFDGSFLNPLSIMYGGVAMGVEGVPKKYFQKKNQKID